MYIGFISEVEVSEDRIFQAVVERQINFNGYRD